MSNIISFNGKVTSGDDSLVMSNGGTDVFINILALSGAAIAQTESEKRLMVYLSEKDQTVGRGCVGFAIIEMPWDKETFEADKSFMIKVINGARNKIGWEKLDYSPNEEFVLHYLDTFENLINRMTIDDIREESLENWLAAAEAGDPISCEFPRCKKHNTFLTCFGCQICNH
ncbi:MAG: hypothetical protein HDR08_05030 [Lachnospiraceae bacterium]|nr:hypothetical protein [Lachnospiraceae bacterium]